MPLFKNASANTSQRVMPVVDPFVRCPACHEDAVASKVIQAEHSTKSSSPSLRQQITSWLMLCCSHNDDDGEKGRKSNKYAKRQRHRVAECRACGFHPEYYSRPGSDILDTDFKRPPQQHPGVLPLRPPSTTWIVRTGWTPQPDLLDKMDRVWCGECGLFVEKKPISGGCSKCGPGKEDESSSL